MAVVKELCGVCRQVRVDYDNNLGPCVCDLCEKRYPDSLIKALVDPFDYACRTRNGDRFRFETCSIRGEWVHLIDVRDASPGYSFDRGVDIRISDIVWCADAPQGS